MPKRHPIASLLIMLTLLVCAGCGGGGATLDTQPLVDTSNSTSDLDYTAFIAGYEADTAATELPVIPLDEGMADKSSSAADDLSLMTVLGKDYLQMDGGHVDGAALVLESGGSSSTVEPFPAYGMYKLSGLLGKRPLSLNIECVPGGLDQTYYIAVADYTANAWQWFGPVTFPEYELDLRETDHQLVTHLGNIYFMLVAQPGNSATHFQTSVVLGDPRPNDRPGSPHHLVASDGQVPEGIAVSWMPGNGVAGYEVWRISVQPDAEWEHIGNTAEPHFVDTPLPDYKLFAYRVRGINPSGESAWSNIDTGFAGGGEDPCAIRGQITAWNGEPAPGIYVGLAGMGEELLRRTNEQGKFYFGDLPPGEFIVVPLNEELLFAPEYHGVELTVEQRFADLHFNAVPEDVFHRVGGFAVTPDESKPCGFSPLAETVIYCESIENPELNFATMTDQHGFWKLTELPEGLYFAVAVKEGWDFVPSVVEVIINGHNRPDRTDFIGLPVEVGDPVD